MTALAAPGRVMAAAAPLLPQAEAGFQIVDGAGTMTVSPASVPAPAVTTLTFTYTAAATQPLKGGSIALDVPPGWTPPALAGPGDVTVACAGQGCSLREGIRLLPADDYPAGLSSEPAHDQLTASG